AGSGPATVVLFCALGLAPPLLTQTYVAVASADRTYVMFWLVPRPASLNLTVSVPLEFKVPEAEMKCGLTAYAGAASANRKRSGAPSSTRSRFMTKAPCPDHPETVCRRIVVRVMPG